MTLIDPLVADVDWAAIKKVLRVLMRGFHVTEWLSLGFDDLF